LPLLSKPGRQAHQQPALWFVICKSIDYIEGTDEAAMAEEAVTLEFLARLCQQTLQEARAARKDVADVRTLSLQTVEYVRRLDRRMGDIERRMSEMRDDLELMIKAELGGALANMQTQLENNLQPIQDKILELDKLDERVNALERGPR
jgi:hypothetical protein